jgi:SAM-dependent methyltransferase
VKKTICPCCGGPDLECFYEALSVPTNSCLLVGSAEEALRFPTADIRLAVCTACGFMFNAEWEPRRTVYSDAYEETQAFSPTFNAFNEELARDLVARHGVRGKLVVEVGCGKGEFITLLCELGDNRGIGYDPSFVPARRNEAAAKRVRFLREFFTEGTVLPPPDLLCCKMTLEHVFEPGRFVRAMRRVLADNGAAVVFILVPDAARILAEPAFWDVYYEHCCYFTATSLRRLFRDAGFRDLRVWKGYSAQYLMLEARPGGAAEDRSEGEDSGEAASLIAQAHAFTATAAAAQRRWRAHLRRAADAGRRVVLWGSGSKAVSFLTTLGIRREIAHVVDINPHRHGRYMPGTGQLIVAPQFLAAYRPDEVIVMNPVYIPEVSASLARLALHPELHALGALEHQPV